jgi:hypothetical protein
MNCQRARESFADLLDSRTPASAHQETRTHLAECPDCQREFAALSQTLNALDTMPVPQPSPRLRRNFYAMLEEEKHSAESVRVAVERPALARRAWLWRRIVSPLAGAALLLLGFVAGQRSVVPAPLPQAVANTPSVETAAMQQKIAQLENQMNKMGTLVGYSLMLPANDRLREVFASSAQASPNEATVNELIRTLALDPSVNVRLAAIEKLYVHADQALVRASVLAQLNREPNPVVQVEMIEFIATAQDKEARPALTKLFADTTADENVRDAARRALAQL